MGRTAESADIERFQIPTVVTMAVEPGRVYHCFRGSVICSDDESSDTFFIQNLEC
jgi:hypothetical protein